MAKSMSKAEKMLYMYTNPKKSRKLAERYGIDITDYGFNAPDGGIKKRTPDQFADDIADAARADYDTQRYLEARALSGNERAKAIGGIDTIEEAQKAFKMMRTDHEKENGGAFTSAEDFYGVRMGAIERDRNKLLNQILDQSEGQADTDGSGGSEESVDGYELSPELNAAIDRNREFEDKRYAGEIFADAFSEAGDEGFRRDNPFLFSFADRMRLG